MRKAIVLASILLVCMPVVSAQYVAKATWHEFWVYNSKGECVFSGVTPFRITDIDVDNAYLLVCTNTSWCKVYYIPTGEILLRETNISLVYPYIVKHAFGEDFAIYKLGNSIVVQKDELKRYIMAAILEYMKTGDEGLKEEILDKILLYIGG